MADTFATPSENVTSRTFWKLLRKAAPMPMIKHLFLQFLEALLLRRAAPMPMINGKYSSVSSLRRMVVLHDGFLSVIIVVDMAWLEMCSICLLTSMELILIPNCSLLHFLSNGVNSLKMFFLEKKIIATIILKIIINHKKRLHWVYMQKVS